MGSANGTSRGQLRPYLTGRTPPFLLVGLLVILGILGFSYWSLNTQYNDLQIEIQKLEERLRVYAEKRESVEKMNSALQAQMQTYKEENRKYGMTVYKRDQELSTLAEQLRTREEEISKANSQIESLKSSLAKLESRDKQKDLEISSLQDQAKSLKIENQELGDSKADIQKKLEKLRKHLEQKGGPVDTNSVLQDMQSEKREESLDPNVGMPPLNREIKFQPQIPSVNNIKNIDEPKALTVALESPDENNLDKIPDVTSKVQLNDVGNGVNDADLQGLQSPGAKV